MTPPNFESIEKLHQQVREKVEEMEPTYKVISIDCFSTTNYVPTLETQWEIHPDYLKYVHTFTSIRFRVRAVYVADKSRKLSADVYVTMDGKLHIGDRLISV